MDFLGLVKVDEARSSRGKGVVEQAVGVPELEKDEVKSTLDKELVEQVGGLDLKKSCTEPEDLGLAALKLSRP